MRTAAVRVLQESLIEEGRDPGKVDGKLGKNTYNAVAAALASRLPAVPENWTDWPDSRKCVAMLQLFCSEQGIDSGKIDGYWGPQTEYAFDVLCYLRGHGEFPPDFRDDEPIDVNPNLWPVQDEPELIRNFGEKGENQTRLVLPYHHRLSWDLRKTVQSFWCHEKVHDSAHRVLTRVLGHYGPERIRELRLDRWGGCMNVRKMRGGSKWSMHSWGIAIDYDTEFNQYNWGRDRAGMASPEYTAWWLFWEEEGWVSLGRTRNFDWMHLQAAKL